MSNENVVNDSIVFKCSSKLKAWKYFEAHWKKFNEENKDSHLIQCFNDDLKFYYELDNISVRYIWNDGFLILFFVIKNSNSKNKKVINQIIKETKEYFIEE